MVSFKCLNTFVGAAAFLCIRDCPLTCGVSLAGVKGAQHRIANLVRGKKVQEGQVIIGVEEMVSELLPGKWFGLDMS
ncbi:Protein prrc1 [Desmophyllum pertusum]|uniref:Protein prrc1 n=1 Tax=Desmophyllum pertusum TaxID=174260 RepID=A0A9W9Y791_9CNID|nr:Protein prrc1 [Desmophyllum pertusum]